MNLVCPEYASANRVFAAAWAADNSSAETLFVLDSDTLFLEEPALLSADFDFAGRPVDVKGSASAGADDRFEAYWRAVGALAGFEVESLPWIETIFDKKRVRASYNGGYVVVRRATGILQKAAELFSRTVEARLRPGRGDHRVFASTGYVSPEANEYWGSNQTIFAIAAWSTSRRMHALDRRYNVPLHLLSDPLLWSADWRDLRPIHVHYHWMLRSRFWPRARRTLEQLGVAADRLKWLDARVPL